MKENRSFLAEERSVNKGRMIGVRSRPMEADFLGGEKKWGWDDLTEIANNFSLLCLSRWPLTVKQKLIQGSMWFNYCLLKS